VVVLPEVYGRHAVITGAAVLVGVVLALSLVWPLLAPKQEPAGTSREVTPP
jgi:hypothetical protein